MGNVVRPGSGVAAVVADQSASRFAVGEAYIAAWTFEYVAAETALYGSCVGFPAPQHHHLSAFGYVLFDEGYEFAGYGTDHSVAALFPFGVYDYGLGV